MPVKQLKAITRYESGGAPGLLSLSVGDIVTEIKPAENGWVLVRDKTGKEGSVPATHLSRLITKHSFL